MNYCVQKDNPNHVCITVCVNLIEYPRKLTTRTADLTTSKLMWNSVISMPDAHYICMYIKSFYLKTPLNCTEYKQILNELLPKEFQEAYDHQSKVRNRYIYMFIYKGMYNLP